ncbi:24070_t:CDS:2 [Dentiscutata erythropus]|uniref:24070_t:CDS:1 n=1 Tax=Dentiscutata erythropus TaxID=1348616 RepID=A0A9N8VD63_9GLOM|nr:24070_t:CDS:2 [Dentiscutata erythropus]
MIALIRSAFIIADFYSESDFINENYNNNDSQSFIAGVLIPLKLGVLILLELGISIPLDY